MNTHKFAVIVPAAGLGTRMKSETPKFLHRLCGRSMVSHILYALCDSADEIIVVVGNGKDQVIEEIETQCADFRGKISFAHQEEQLGSGHAVLIGMGEVSSSATDVMVVLGDTPLVTNTVINEMKSRYIESGADVLVSTAILEDPHGYGRIERDENKIVTRIVEEKDCDEAQRAIRECNMYPFIFTRTFLESAIDKLDRNNAQGEMYLTDLVELARSYSRPVSSYTFADAHIAFGVNDRAQLAQLEKYMRDDIIERHLAGGVTIVDPATTYIDVDVVIEADVTILPGTTLEGATSIARGSTVGPNTRIVDSVIGKNCVIESSTIKGSTLLDGVTVGPYSSLRAGTYLCEDVHVGTFVEMKKTRVGKKSKVPHLSYLGDATIGENTNLGAGTTTANYDGVNKHPTVIGNDVKTGVNTVFVAPVTVGDGAYTGAGAVVTKDIPRGSLAKGVPAVVDENWTPPKKAQ